MIDYQLRAAKLLQASLRAANYTPPEPKAARVKPQPVDLWPLANKIACEVSNCVPDCDPIDVLGPHVRRYYGDDVTLWLNRAARKHLSVKSYNAYLIDAWDGWNEVCEPDQRMPNPWRPA